MTIRLLLIACVGLVLALVGHAAAEPRVHVSGDARATGAVRQALAGKATLVDDPASAGAIVEVSVASGKGKLAATIVVRQGKDGAELDRLVVRERKRKLGKAIARQLWKQLGPAITRAEPAPPPAPPAVAEAPPAPPPAPAVEAAPAPAAAAAEVRATVAPARARPARVLIAVDERPFWRRLRYNDDLDQVLRGYDLAANAVGVAVAVRPLAGVPGLHVTGTGELTVGVNGSRTSDGMAFDTRASEWSAGLGYDLRVAGMQVGLAAGYGEQRFTIADEAMPRELVPDVTYRWARAGLDGERPLGRRLALSARAGYRHLLGTGELTASGWFPRATGAGLDGALGVQARLSGRLVAYARAEVRHYFFAMNPVPGDPLVAGGAVDSYLGGAIGLAVRVR